MVALFCQYILVWPFIFQKNSKNHLKIVEITTCREMLILYSLKFYYLITSYLNMFLLRS